MTTCQHHTVVEVDFNSNNFAKKTLISVDAAAVLVGVLVVSVAIEETISM